MKIENPPRHWLFWFLVLIFALTNVGRQTANTGGSERHRRRGYCRWRGLADSIWSRPDRRISSSVADFPAVLAAEEGHGGRRARQEASVVSASPRPPSRAGPLTCRFRETTRRSCEHWFASRLSLPPWTALTKDSLQVNCLVERCWSTRLRRVPYCGDFRHNPTQEAHQHVVSGMG